LTIALHRGPDGDYIEIESTEWWSPTGPLQALTDLIKPTAVNTDSTTPVEIGTSDADPNSESSDRPA
jgi:hypothetical protein